MNTNILSYNFFYIKVQVPSIGYNGYTLFILSSTAIILFCKCVYTIHYRYICKIIIGEGTLNLNAPMLQDFSPES